MTTLNDINGANIQHIRNNKYKENDIIKKINEYSIRLQQDENELSKRSRKRILQAIGKLKRIKKEYELRKDKEDDMIEDNEDNEKERKDKEDDETERKDKEDDEKERKKQEKHQKKRKDKVEEEKERRKKR